ncbi:DUF6577 family protein [Paramuribaculum intestinale]|uniref:DUF6577 family protein n=1 Tax=Paramuribaculum intestinale TaxID=2094151 RepID=UPI002729C3ED|nr:DUF6577 family protein [Paramuribaculum intestinale]
MTETRNAILTFAENRDSFRFAELLLYLNGLFEISKVTLSWYLREMVNDNIIFKLGRGIYTAHKVHTSEYTPRLRTKAVKVGKIIARKFPFVSVCVLDGQVFADFQHHISSNNVIYMEVDRDAMESVFHTLKQEGHTAYLNPSKDFVYENIDLSKEAVIVKPLISESPLLDFKGVKTPRLEKILVDIYCDDDLDYLHGNEWSRMFDNALSMYSVNRTAMLRYASRRNAKPAIEKAIENLGTHND